jgi:hypothetical protein
VKRQRDGTDGFFELYYQHGWAWLTVFPPDEHGKPVYYEEIRNRMRLLEMPNVTYDMVNEIIREAAGIPQPLVEWPEGSRLASHIGVSLADDEMAAYVEISSPKKGAAAPTVEDVVEQLEDKGVVYGIDRERIERLLIQREFDRPVQVAGGRAAVDAQAAQIRYHFHPNRGKPYLELDFGRIDLKELAFIENKKSGDVLAELTEPVGARNGRTVTGTVLYANTETHPAELKAGKNTQLNAAGDTLYATADGNVRLWEGAVIVEPVVTVKNVSYETGHIRHDGSVVVEEHVADGFIVEATGDIEVGRGVGKATLKAGGNILLKTGINGNGEGSIEAGGNLFAKYVESCTAQSGGHIFVQEAIMHSRISAWHHCVLNGRRSEVVGTNMIVGGTLWCKQLGSVAEGSSHVSIGIPPDLLAQFRNTKNDLESSQGELERVQQQLRPLEEAVNQGRRQEKILQACEQLRQSARDLTGKISQLRAALKTLRERVDAGVSGMLVVEHSMYKGVVVAFGTKEYRVPEDGVRGTILKRVGHEIKESGFNPADPPELTFEA